MLKRLLEGRPFAYPRKCEADLIFKFSGPVIFVSNECDETMDDALKSRLLFVSANEPFWEEVEEWLPKGEGIEI